MISYERSLTVIPAIIIIFRIALPLLAMQVDLVVIGLSKDGLSILYTVSDLIVMGYLFYFVRYVKKQKIWLGLAVVWIMLELYALVIPYVLDLLVEDMSGMSNLQMQLMLLCRNNLEPMLKNIIILILSVLLIRNQAEGDTRKNIRLTGILMLIEWGILLFVVVAVITFNIQISPAQDYLLKILTIAHVAIYVGMAYMYQQERKAIASKA